MKIIYLPLDERPCNYQYPYDIAKTNDEIDVVRPNLSQLGNKKVPANSSQLASFLEKEVEYGVTVICSIDMLVYGGLIPSRLHHQDYKSLISRLDNLCSLKEKYDLKIYAFSSIMRTPRYSSSDEEPDYYEEYGEQIYTRKKILDMIQRNGSSKQLQDELIKNIVPEGVIADYETRRDINIRVNQYLLKLLEDNVFEHLVIFQDDSAPYGYTAIDQKVIKDEISNMNLDDKVDIYPGADEVGCSLLALAYNKKKNVKNRVFPKYSSVNGISITPLYEDRPMFETLKSHINVTSAILVDNSSDADIILMINSPGKMMQESWEQFTKRDRTYDSHRNLKDFVRQVEYYVSIGKTVAVADCAYANGCDIELINALDRKGLLDKIISFTGWNTHANTLGTVISSMQIAKGISKEAIRNNVMHIIEAGFYQASIRMDINKNYLPEMGLNYFDLKNRQNDVVEIEMVKVKKLYEQLNLSKKYPLKKIGISHPWNRMFEVMVEIKI